MGHSGRGPSAIPGEAALPELPGQDSAGCSQLHKVFSGSREGRAKLFHFRGDCCRSLITRINGVSTLKMERANTDCKRGGCREELWLLEEGSRQSKNAWKEKAERVYWPGGEGQIRNTSSWRV